MEQNFVTITGELMMAKQISRLMIKHTILIISPITLS